MRRGIELLSGTAINPCATRSTPKCPSRGRAHLTLCKVTRSRIPITLLAHADHTIE
jgi:hypothetical protein